MEEEFDIKTEEIISQLGTVKKEEDKKNIKFELSSEDINIDLSISKSEIAQALQDIQTGVKAEKDREGIFLLNKLNYTNNVGIKEPDVPQKPFYSK